TGVRFDGAAVVNFGGFDKVVQELGGVYMCIDDQVTSIHTGHVFDKGCYNLTPAETLDYLRQRETLPNGDYDRHPHHQQFLKAIFQKTFASGLTHSPLRLDQIIRDVGSSLTVDLNGVPVDQLAYTLRNINPSSMIGIKLPSRVDNIGGVSFVVADDSAYSLYEAIYTDTLPQWVSANPDWVNSL